MPTPNASPWGIVAGLDGNLWFTEYLAGKIGRITPAGVITEYDLPVAGAFPSAIAVGPDGHLWYTEYQGNAIGKLTLGPDLVQVHGDGTVTASVETAISISATPSVSFRTLAIGETAIAAPNPASVRVTTNSSGYTLGVSRTPFTGGADIPLTVSVTAPPTDLLSGAFAFTPLAGPTSIPTDGTLTVGARLSGSAMTGDEWTPVYRIGPIPLRPSGPTSSVITYTAVAQ